MINLGIDVGSVSAKLAVIGDVDDRELLERICSENPAFLLVQNGNVKDKVILLSGYRRIKGEPIFATYELLEELFDYILEIDGIRVTGVGSGLIGQLLSAKLENDFRAVAKGVGSLYPDVKTIFEMGGVNSKYISIEIDETLGAVRIKDYERNGECAAGTGSFMDQQAERLKFAIEDVGDIVMAAGTPANIAGRCSVFAKSDMVHAAQKGIQPPEILKGLCEAVVRNFKSTITKGKKVEPKVAFIGGVAANKGIVQAMRTTFDFNPLPHQVGERKETEYLYHPDEEGNEFFVPEYYAWMGAIGAALLDAEAQNTTAALTSDSIETTGKRTGAAPTGRRSNRELLEQLKTKAEEQGGEEFATMPQLSMEKVTLLRDRAKPYSFEGKQLPINAYLGIDVGSVSTNLVLLDENGDLIYDIYERTRSRPIEVVTEGLREIERELGDNIAIKGVGTTGSGRELIGKLIGADIIYNEITAHKTGANFVGKKLIDRVPDTIFEIGGQDSKYISIDNDIVVDFAMNEACAAGTGSFLEEQAERMGIQIIDEFAELALNSPSPLMLGERCTVFMERDITPLIQRGAKKENLTAGLAYSIATNYLNRVVSQYRRIGDTIFFQGGTAYNDSVAAAFSTILDKEIIVPPYNGVIGAIGAALLAQEKIESTEVAGGTEPAATGSSATSNTTFRGYDVDKIDYKRREFVCPGCSNHCDIMEITVEGERTYWGDQCSEKYRKRKIDKEPAIIDLIELHQQALMEGCRGFNPRTTVQPPNIGSTPEHSEKGEGVSIGIPFALYFYDRLPFWNNFFKELGFNVIHSPKTNKSIVNYGIDAVVAEPCFPIKLVHGHINALLQEGADYLFLPNIVNAETKFSEVNSHVCPWGSTAPFVIKYAPLMGGIQDKLLHPAIHFRDGMESVKKELRQFTKQFGISKKQTDKAVEAGYKAQRKFQEKLHKAGQEALEVLEMTGELGIVLVGRPYNIYDSRANLDVAKKLRDYYGVNVIPMDFLQLDDVDISDINANMYWNYGQKILQAAKIVKEYDNLHIIYITNFKCGPDSYIKHFVKEASQKPFLTLQFDEHSNDAGMITRCEAYLDSKGFLRWWKRDAG